MCHEDCVDHEGPAPGEITVLRMDAVDEPDQQWRQQGQHKQRVACCAVVGVIHHGVAERYEDVQVRDCPENTTPQKRLAADLPAHYCLADCGAQCDLRQGIHG